MPIKKLAPNVLSDVTVKYADIVDGQYGPQIRFKGTVDGDDKAMLFLPGKLPDQITALQTGGILRSDAVPTFDPANISNGVALKLSHQRFAVLLSQPAGEKYGKLQFQPVTNGNGPAAPSATPAVVSANSLATAAQPAPTKESLSKLYLETTQFVLDKVVPLYVAKDIGCSDTGVAAMVATLVIQRCREER